MSVAQGLVNRLEREGFVKAPVKGKRLVEPLKYYGRVVFSHTQHLTSRVFINRIHHTVSQIHLSLIQAW